MCDSILQNAVLTRVATAHGVDPESVCLGDKGAVFYRCGDDLKCLCQMGSHYWNELEAEELTAQAIAHAARRLNEAHKGTRSCGRPGNNGVAQFW